MTFVVGVDGSDHGAAALRWACAEAAPAGMPVVAVLVWDLFNQLHEDGSRRFEPDYDDGHAEAALAAAVTAAIGEEAAAEVARRVVCDHPAHGLLEAAEGADLLVVGARGLGGFRGLLLGSVSQQCLHHAAGPLAIVPPAAAREPGGAPPERVVVGVDGSPAGAAALGWALAAGARRGAVVEAVHAWELPLVYGPLSGGLPYDVAALEAAAQRCLDVAVDRAVAAAEPITVERSLVPEAPARALLDAAAGASLVVVGRRGQGGFSRLLVGSVSEKVARHAPCPVVVVPAPAPDEAVDDG